jgi:UDP-N-acetylglucosamine 1-carboxyvinyltransferase
MEYFKVKGNTKLSGVFEPKGNKNAALPLIAATLLTKDEIILNNLPNIEDVKIMLKIIENLGAEVTKLDTNKVKIKATNIHNNIIDHELGQLIRTSILLAGPLLARTGEVILSKPGGDGIGRRRLDTHFLVFERLGTNIEFDTDIHLKTDKLQGKYLFLDEASVTATENAIMASVLAEGETTIYNAACEPHIQDLCNFLNFIGANIKGIETNKLIIEGVKFLKGGEWTVISDHIEVGSVIGLAAITHSELTITGTIPQHYINIKKYYNKLGVDFEIKENSLFVPAKQKLIAKSDFDGAHSTLSDSIWPGFPSDLTSIAVVMATQIKGTTLIFEKMFESRLFFTDKLVGLGAKIILCDPHRAVVTGPSKLYSGKITSPDIRAGMAMLISALVADGISSIYNIKQIDRGYERIDERLNKLGADIQRIRID